ncbi:hypothetical protein HN028_14310 [Pantoea ananatis]|uniref:DUF6950 family protein n=1 Tax=Pantoea ananas TaxID=553 RepID=UPI00352B3943
MHQFTAELSNLINRYSFKEHIIGQNDCNIFLTEYIDLLNGTDYKSKVINQYSTIPEGLRKTKKLTGFKDILDACEKYFVPSDVIQDGSVIISKRTLKNKDFYSASIVFGNQALIEEQNIYKPKNVSEIEYEFIFNRS